MKLPCRRPHSLAFSLVEVALAIGIASFCLLAVVGLLPTALASVRVSRQEAGAARCLEQITQAIRAGIKTGASEYTAGSPYTNLTWTGTSGSATTFGNLSLGGLPTTAVPDQHLVARVEIKPAAADSPARAALVSIAWPNKATWSESQSNWVSAQGSVSTWVVFRSPE
jgi:type II secretory pathway pseudopilin PulG